jgi:hypothetical protein
MNGTTVAILIFLGFTLVLPLLGLVAIKTEGLRPEPTLDEETGDLICNLDSEYFMVSWFPTLATSAVAMTLLNWYNNKWVGFIALVLSAIWLFLSVKLGESAVERKWNPWLVHLIGTPILVAVIGALALSVTLTQDPTPKHGYSFSGDVPGESVTLYMDANGGAHREELKRPIIGQILQNHYANDETVFWDERNGESKVVSASANKSDALGRVYNPVTFIEDLNPGDTPYAVAKVEYKLDKGVDPSEYPCATNKTDACKSSKLNATIVSEGTTIHLPKGERNKYVKEQPSKDSGK